MKSYNEIFTRILEIIKLSDDVLKTNNYHPKDFCTINHFTIYKDYVEEFKELLDSERTYFLLNTNRNNNVGKKNCELMQLCRESVKNDVVYRDEYIALFEILKRSFKHNALELIEHSGYYVLKEDYEDFCKLCQLLKVGPNVSVKNISKEEIKKIVLSNLKNVKNQYTRIKGYYDTLVLKKDTSESNDSKEEESNNKIEIAEDTLDKVINDTELLTEDVVQVESVLKEERIQGLNCDFEELIFLGLNGMLTEEMVVQLKYVLEPFKYKQLLNLLSRYKIFDDKTIFNLRRRLVTKFKVLNDIDELVAFLAIRKGINIDSLKSLIPYIGLDNYHYLIDELFKYGTIDFDDYKKYLIENEFLEDSQNLKK